MHLSNKSEDTNMDAYFGPVTLQLIAWQLEMVTVSVSLAPPTNNAA